MGAEWRIEEEGPPPMALGERIKALRKEAGPVPGGASVDAVVRIAEAFNVSIDYLLVEDAPRRPLHVADFGLATRLADIAELSAEDRSSLLHMLDALVTKNRLKALARERS